MNGPLSPSTEPTVIVEIDGRRAGWWPDGRFAGDLKMVDTARAWAGRRQVVVVGLVRLTVNAETALGATTALLALAPMEAVIVRAPDDVAERMAALRKPLTVTRKRH